MSATGPRPEPPPVLPILGLLTADQELAQHAANELARDHGGLGLSSQPQPFDHTTYYEPEMGPGLHRFFCSFHQLLAAEQLPAFKWRAWQLEQQLSKNGCRRINLDPGYLDSTKVVLASFKAGPQKLYLGEAVWADLVLFFTDGAYRHLLWTFPDLRDGPHLDLFTQARNHYKQQLRQRRQAANDEEITQRAT